MFSQPDWAKVLEVIAAGYGINVRRESQLVEVNGEQQQAVVLDTKTGTKETIEHAMLHAVPPQSAPDWVTRTPLPDPASRSGMSRSTSTPCRARPGPLSSLSVTSPICLPRRPARRSAKQAP
jgi:hypothetical protein